MAISHKVENDYKDIDGSEKIASLFSFTNGARDQFIALMGYFKQPSELETMKLAISFLQRIKEQQEQQEKTREAQAK